MIGYDTVEGKKNLNSKAELVTQHEYLVSQIAERFNNVSEPRENLEEVGYIGLLNAVNLYDSNNQKVNFKTYAQILITEGIHQYLLNRNRQVERPDWLVRLNQQIDEFVIRYREKHQRFPKLSEIAAYLNINAFGLQEVLKARDSLRECRFPKKIGQNLDLVQMQPDLEKVKSQSYQSFKLPIEDLITLQKAFKKLKKLQEGIIYYLFVMDLRKTKAAQKLGLSQGSADQIKKDLSKYLS